MHLFFVLKPVPLPWLSPFSRPLPILHRLALVPAKGDVSRSVPSFLHQRLVELSAGPGVDGRPAVLAVVLQTGHVGAEERSKLPAAAGALALITELVIQDIWLHFHLTETTEEWEKWQINKHTLWSVLGCHQQDSPVYRSPRAAVEQIGH